MENLLYTVTVLFHSFIREEKFMNRLYSIKFNSIVH